jgi:amidase
MDELWRWDARRLATAIRDREVSSREVVEAHLARIDDVNPKVNAVVRSLADEARAAADAADAAVAAGGPLGPLHGVPITVKENIDLAGTPTTQSVVAFADAVADTDAPAVERMRAAGAIPIGRTNLPDFGLRVATESSLHGITRNPWNPERTAGGSSGGEAVALATGMSPLGLGNDLGGSLRNPAHCCGIASIKPTTGVVGHASVIPPEDQPISFQVMAVEGVMARRVADVRLGLEIVAGVDVRDPTTVPVDLAAVAPSTPCRVALVPEPPGGATHPGVAAVIRRAGDVLADAGFDVVEVTPPSYEQAVALWAAVLLPDVRSLLPLLETVLGPDGVTFLRYADELFPPFEVASWSAAWTERSTVARQWAAFHDEHPMIVSPVWSQPAFPHGWDVASFENGTATLELMRPVLPANLLGLPAAVVPGGLVNDLPVGVQVIGGRFADLACLATAEVIEASLGLPTPIDPRG